MEPLNHQRNDRLDLVLYHVTPLNFENLPARRLPVGPLVDLNAALIIEHVCLIFPGTSSYSVDFEPSIGLSSGRLCGSLSTGIR